MSTINAGSTTPTALTLTGTTDGTLDLATGGTIRMTIDGSGRALVGTTTPISTSTANLQVVGSGVTGSASFAKSDITTSGGSLVGIDAWAYDGSVYNIAGTINFRAAENWSSTNHGTDLQFRLVPSGAGAGLTEVMRISSNGNVGIGGTADARSKLQITGTLPTDGTNSLPVVLTGTIPSGTTSQAQMFRSNPTTQATSFTLSNLSHFVAGSATFGAGSTVVNQYGFWATSQITNATNNYGFYSDIASAANRWNFYAAGTAVNYFAGDTRIGTTADLGSGARVNIQSADAEADVLSMRYFSASAGKHWRFAIDSNSTFFIWNQGATGVYLTDGATSWTGTSDERTKTDLRPIENAASKVATLRAVTGRFKHDEESVSRAFLIAQDVQKILPEAVTVQSDEQGTLGLAYTDVIPLLVAAIKEQQTMIDELKAKVAALETK